MKSFYDTRRWEMLRQSVLRRDGYMCQDRKRYGKMVQATQVHHIFPREQFPQFQWCAWNLIALCNDAHNEMHYRTDRKLTPKGADLLRRTALKQGISEDVYKDYL